MSATTVYATSVPASFLKQVTYVLKGINAHEDFCGHAGQLKPGDLQVLQHYMLIVFYKCDFTAEGCPACHHPVIQLYCTDITQARW